MPTTYHPDLLDALESVETSWSGRVWRQVIGSLDPTVPNTRGARWNPAGVEALYFSSTQAGASAEVANLLARQSPPVRRPLSTYQFEVALSRVADITGGALEAAGFPTSLLLDDLWDIPAHIGGAAAYLEIGGLLVPSARHSDSNLVVFVNNLQPEDALRLIEE